MTIGGTNAMVGGTTPEPIVPIPIYQKKGSSNPYAPSQVSLYEGSSSGTLVFSNTTTSTSYVKVGDYPIASGVTYYIEGADSITLYTSDGGESFASFTGNGGSFTMPTASALYINAYGYPS